MQSTTPRINPYRKPQGRWEICRSGKYNTSSFRRPCGQHICTSWSKSGEEKVVAVVVGQGWEEEGVVRASRVVVVPWQHFQPLRMIVSLVRTVDENLLQRQQSGIFHTAPIPWRGRED